MEKILKTIRNVPDFPKPGIQFKDITPILHDPQLCGEIAEAFAVKLGNQRIDAVAGIESRGFLFGMLLAQKLGVPFIMIRKSGKLPFTTVGIDYALEYGTARIEMHTDAMQPGWNVVLHDDLLATGGTAAAAARLTEMQGARVAAFAFVVELGFLHGRNALAAYCENIISLVNYEGE